MYLERAYRQVALVSYGNEFLSGSVDSEILDRHPLLFTHFPILRDLEHGTLLAGSASHLLNHLKDQGLHRISLHIASDVSKHITDSKVFDLNTSENDFCIVCHFPNQIFKVLIYAEEKPLWQEYDQDQYPLQSNYNNYHHSVENYILIDVSNECSDLILHDLQPFSWKSLFDEYQNQIYGFDISRRYGTFPIPLTESNCYEGDLYQKEEQFPLLPFSLKRNYASNLIINIASLNYRFNVESHAKNEYADYWHMAENEKIEFSQASQKVAEFFPILLKHCANHYRHAALDTQINPQEPFKFTLQPSRKTENLDSSSPSEINDENPSLDNNSSGFNGVRVIKFGA